MRSNMMSMPSASADPAIYTRAYEVPEQYAIHVPDEVYRELAELIRVECEYGGKESVKVNVECERDGFLYTVETSMYCYFGRSCELWGIEYYLKGLAPCWTEFHAYNDDGDEILNDFDLSKFNKLITF